MIFNGSSEDFREEEVFTDVIAVFTTPGFRVNYPSPNVTPVTCKDPGTSDSLLVSVSVSKVENQQRSIQQGP